jgi:hypothetical protein
MQLRIMGTAEAPEVPEAAAVTATAPAISWHCFS